MAINKGTKAIQARNAISKSGKESINRREEKRAAKRGNSGLKILDLNVDDLVKSQNWDGKVKSTKCKACES